jgi:hypothetical protein
VLKKGQAMFKSLFRKAPILISCVVVVLVLSAGAFAYWSTTGSGTGSATNALANGTLVLHATPAAGMTPGKSQAVPFTADNAGNTSLRIGTLTSVVSIDGGHPTCLPGDFSVAAVAENQTIPKTTAGVVLTPGTIVFADTALNQDGCKGAIVTLTLTGN